MVSPQDMQQWICPNDRQLTLRAKLGTGWSFHSGRQNRPRSTAEQISGEEMDHIVRVVKRSERLEETEQKRIGSMVDRLDNMKKLASGNGTTQCVLCAHEFNILNRSSSARCEDCKKAVCTKCGVETFVHSYQQQVWLCKICSENRELWKRSGAWFYKSLPPYILPTRTDNGQPLSTPGPNVSAQNGSPVKPEIGVTQPDGMTTTWTRVRPRHNSSSDSEYSLDGEGVAAEEAPSVEPPPSPGRQPAVVDPQPSPRRESEASSVGGAAVIVEPDSPAPAIDHLDPLSALARRQRGEEEHKLPRSPAMKAGKKMTLLDKVKQQKQPQKPPEEKKKKPELVPQKPGVIRVPGLSEFGYLEFSLYYDSTKSQLSITIIRAWDLKAMDPNGLSDPYVKLHLLPGGDHRTKRRTTTKEKTLSPEWNEEVVYYGLTVADMLKKTLRMSVLDEDVIQFDWIGEYRQPLQEIAPNSHMHLIVPLHAQKKLSAQDLSAKSGRGRILLALSLSQTEGVITVNIVRCAELLPMDPNGYSDPYVKVRLLPDPQKKCKRKTSVKLKTLNPSFNEEFKFSVDPRQAIGRTLDVQVWDYDRAAANDYIGGIQLGLNARGDLLRHWYDMFKYPDKRLEMWHPLAKLKH